MSGIRTLFGPFTHKFFDGIFQSKAFHGIVRAFQDEKAALIKQRVEEGVKRPKAQSLGFLWRFGIVIP